MTPYWAMTFPSMWPHYEKFFFTEQLPDEDRRVAIEAGVSDCWWRYVGSGGRVVGLDRFGASAPASELFEHFGFSVENVLEIARELLAH